MILNKEMFSCSSCWNVKPGKSGQDIVHEIKRLGFSQIELNYSVSKKQYNEILPLVENGEIKISSVHSVFPKTEDEDYGTDSIFLGYLEDDKRKNAVNYMKQTADHANILGAKTIVMHVSQAEDEVVYDNILKDLFRRGLKDTDEYKVYFEKMLLNRQRNIRKYIENIIISLNEVSDYLLKKNYNINLALENRAMSHQIPTFEEAAEIIAALKDAPVGFWYDIGHGIMMENLGLLNVDEGLNLVKDKILGMHIHDAKGMDDHCVPYKYGDAFDKYLEYIRLSPIKVFELGSHNKEEEIKESLDKLVGKLN